MGAIELIEVNPSTDFTEPAVIIAHEKLTKTPFPTESTSNERWLSTEIVRNPCVVKTEISGVKRSLITFIEIARDKRKANIDSSIRITTEGGASYILRHDHHDHDGYKDWELIKTEPKNIPDVNEHAEEAVFKITSTDPNFVLDDALAPEWQKVIQEAVTLLSSLPDKFPEKEVLIKAWEQVRITDKTTHEALILQQIKLDKQKWLRAIEERKSAHLIPPEKPSLFKKVVGKISSPFRKWQELSYGRP